VKHPGVIADAEMVDLCTQLFAGARFFLLPEVARILGESETTLYERMRALVREGLLEAAPGHGRGSGVRASPESMAMLVIGMLATAAWSETGPAARALAEAVPRDIFGGRSNKPSFKDELTRIFADESLASQVERILFESSGWAIIVSNIDADAFMGGAFMSGPAKSGGLQRDSKLTGEAVLALAKLVSA
jgi:hypothetical protein